MKKNLLQLIVDTGTLVISLTDNADYQPNMFGSNFVSELKTYLKNSSNFYANPTIYNCNSLKQASINLLAKTMGFGKDNEQILKIVRAWEDFDCLPLVEFGNEAIHAQTYKTT